MFKQKKINIPIYPVELVLLKSKKLDEIGAKFKFNDFDKYEAVVWRCSKSKHVKLYAAFTEGCDCGVITHECVHLVNHLFLACGLVLDATNDEAQAYLTGYFMKKINKFLKK